MKFFSIIYLIIAGLGLMFVWAPHTLVYALLLTFGLAYPLLYAPAAAVYLTALWPAVLVQRINGSWGFPLALAALCLSAVAFGPGLLANMIAPRDAAPILAQDIVARFGGPPPREIEFERPSRYQGGSDEPLQRADCDALCQTLLLTREVDSVRVTGIRYDRRPLHVVYSYQQRADCPRAFADAATALPATKMALSRGECIVPTINGPSTPNVKIVTSESGKGWASSSTLLHTAGDMTRFEVFVSEAGQWHLLSKTTELRTKVLRMPLLLGFPNSYGLELKPGWERAPVVFNKSDTTSVARASLGYRASPAPTPPPETPLDTIARILERPGTEPIGPELMAPINDYLTAMQKQATLSPADINLLERLVADRRITDHLRVSLVVQRHPQAGAGMVSSILDRLEIPIGEATGHNHNRLAWILVRVPIENLRPHAERILAAAEKSDQWHMSPLLIVVGRFDIDPTNLLRRGLAAASNTVREAAAAGVCLAADPWAAALTPDLRGILEFYRGRRHGGNKDLVLALRILHRSGYESEIEPFLSSLPEHDAGRLRAAIARPDTRFGVPC